MEQPLRLRDIQPAPSAQGIPTIRSTGQVTKRTASYTTPAKSSSETTISQNSHCQKIDEVRHYDQELKAGLTQLLNEGKDKSSMQGRRFVQNKLMETERELRKQHKESLKSRRPSLAWNLSSIMMECRGYSDCLVLHAVSSDLGQARSWWFCWAVICGFYYGAD